MSSLSDVLGQANLKGVKNARVSMTVFVDNGRDDQTFRFFRILTAKPIINLLWTSKAYSFVISDGSKLNPEGLRNQIDVVKIDRSSASVEAVVSFELVLDGKPLVDHENQVFVVAVQAAGPHIYQHPGDSGDPYSDYYYYTGFRDDLHAGNEADGPTGGPDDEWLRNYVSDVDIELVDAEVSALHSRPGYKRSHFG